MLLRVAFAAHASCSMRFPAAHHRCEANIIRCADDDGGAECELSLCKPLGIAFEEVAADERRGVVVGDVLPDGSAAESTYVWPGDLLLAVDDEDVTRCDFDQVMDVLIGGPAELSLRFKRPGTVACVRFPNGKRAFGRPGEPLENLAIEAGFNDQVVYECRQGSCGTCEWYLQLGQSEDDRVRPVRLCRTKVPRVPADSGACSILSVDSDEAKAYAERMARLAEGRQ